MKQVVEPTVPPNEDIDALLGDFFKSEMPDPWPAFRPPVARTLPFRAAAQPRRRFVLGSKVALAASVALLMLCGWMLSGNMVGHTQRGPGISGSPGPGTADPREDPLRLFDKLPKGEPTQPGKVKSSLNLRQNNEGGTEIEITVTPIPSNK